MRASSANPSNEGLRCAPSSAFLGVAIVILGGCAGDGAQTSRGAEDPPPTVVVIERADYARWFDAAVALSGEEDMPAELRDRDGGIIETRPKVAGSLIEPWDWPRGDVGEAVEATLSFERRRARFEFLPSGFRPEAGFAVADDDARLAGRRTPGSTDPTAFGAVDLSRYEGPIEVRVWVWVERAFTPNLQRSPWTFSQTTFASDPTKSRPTGDASTRDRSIWTPIARDAAMETILLDKLVDRIGADRPG
jgi:hypothetical protein